MAADTNLGASMLGKFFCKRPSALQNNEWNFCKFDLIIPLMISSEHCFMIYLFYDNKYDDIKFYDMSM